MGKGVWPFSCDNNSVTFHALHRSVFEFLKKGIQFSPRDCVRMHGCFQFFSLLIWLFICLRIWLVVSCFPAVCLHLSRSSSLPVWLMVSGSACVWFHLSRNLAGGVWLVVSGSPAVCFHLFPFICFPVLLVVSCSLAACRHLSPSCAPVVSQLYSDVSPAWFPRY